MTRLALQEATLTEAVNQIARQEGKAAEAILADAVRHYLNRYRDKRIRAEADYWYNLPTATRNQYVGMVVAVYNRVIVDTDPDRRTLYLRMKERFGREPVLLVDGGAQPIPDFQVHSVIS